MKGHIPEFIPVRIEGTSAALRLFRESDSKYLFAAIERNRTFLRKYLPWLDYNTKEEHTLDFIKTKMEEINQSSSFTLAIVDQTTDMPIGVVGFHPFRIDEASGKRVAELGYWLDEAYNGHGICTKASCILLDLIKTANILDVVLLRAATFNHGSQRIAEKLGMSYDKTVEKDFMLNGTLIDLKYYHLDL